MVANDRKRIVIDLDGTLCGPPLVKGDYSTCPPISEVVAALARYRADGFYVIVATARQMRTHANNVGAINAHTLPAVIEWLGRHAIPYDEIHVGKPWCGYEGFYVDDRSIRPDEFARLSHEEVLALVHGTTALGQTA